MQYSKNVILPLVFLFAFLTSEAQKIPVRVVNVSTKFPVLNAAVFNTDMSKGTLTDSEGYFDLGLFTPEDSIWISHTSFENIGFTYNDIIDNQYTVMLEPDMVLLEELVVAQYDLCDNYFEVSNMTSRIGTDELSFSIGRTIAEIISDEGNLPIRKGYASDGNLIIRGLSNNKILYMVDGIRVNNAVSGNGIFDFFSELPINAINQIDVIYGPSSVLFGSDAMGGVIRFTTRAPKLSDSDRVLVFGNGQAGLSTADKGRNASFDFNFGKLKWASFTAVSAQSFGNIKTGANKKPMVSNQSQLPNWGLKPSYSEYMNEKDTMFLNSNPEILIGSGYSKYNLLQKVLFTPNQLLDITAGVHFTSIGEVNRTDLLNYQTNNKPVYAEAKLPPRTALNGILQVLSKKENNFYTYLNATLAYGLQNQHRVSRLYNNKYRLHNEENITTTALNLDFIKLVNNVNKLNYGLEYNYNTVASDAWTEHIIDRSIDNALTLYPNGGSENSSYAVYLNYNWLLATSITVTGGIRYNYVELISNFKHAELFSLPSPSIEIRTGAPAANIGFSTNIVETIKLNVLGSSGYRIPNLNDYGIVRLDNNFVRVPNAKLQPEYNYSVEAGLHFSFLDELSFYTSAYHTWVRNAMLLAPFTFDNGANTIVFNGVTYNTIAFANTGKASLKGVNFGFVFDSRGIDPKPSVRIKNKLRILGTVNWVTGAETDTKEPLPYVSPVFGNLTVQGIIDGLKLESYVNFQAKKSIDEISLYDTRALIEATTNGYPAWYTINLRSSYRLNRNFEVQLALENLTNVHYRTFGSGISEHGFNISLCLSVSF